LIQFERLGYHDDIGCDDSSKRWRSLNIKELGSVILMLRLAAPTLFDDLPRHLDFRSFSCIGKRVSEEIGHGGGISSRSRGPQALGENDLVDERAAEVVQFGA
jgi:hypothetical protein